MAYIAMAYIAMAYIVMASLVMAYIVMAYMRARKYLTAVGFFLLPVGVSTLKSCTQIQGKRSFRFTLSPTMQKNQKRISFSDRVGVQQSRKDFN